MVCNKIKIYVFILFFVGIHYIEPMKRSNEFYNCQVNTTIKACLKDTNIDYYYSPGGCYRLYEEKSWINYPSFYVNSQSEISLLGVYSILKEKEIIEENTQS